MQPLPILLCLCLLLGQVSRAEADVWAGSSVARHPDRGFDTSQLSPITLTAAQRKSVASLLKSRARQDLPECDGILSQEWLGNLGYNRIALTPGSTDVLVSTGVGCARGGQGSNGAMWIIQFDGPTPKLLVSPHEDFAGFLFTVEPRTSKGYRDITLGWHNNAVETGLGYFRFDGHLYRRVGAAVLRSDQTGKRTLHSNADQK